jgi:Kef-type K+ transport system membrane component KefB/nucleotide-binding universal stress UspA family protein
MAAPMSMLTLILQIAVVLIAARLSGWLFRRMGQPQVMGEMVAGFLLGPSIFGWLSPDLWARIFPPGSLTHLGPLSQIGVLLFMFLVGLDLDPRLLRNRGHAAVVTSHASIVVPFLLGSLLALYLYPRLSDSSVRFDEFALFMGAAMSVTAFPVLARILAERNLLRTRLGAVTIACAAVDDVTAWVILAGVVALARVDAGDHSLGFTLGGSVVYVALMVYAVRPALGRLEAYYHSRGHLTQDMLALALVALTLSAYTTEWLGIHALFGAFLLGAIMPKDSGFVHELTEKLQDVTVVFLLPLFFAVTGLRTSIGLVSGAEMWIDCALIVAVAVVGKFGGSAIAARLMGLSWREAGALGALMNTRGLIQLVFLTVGLEIGIISPALFTMMVLMALATTFMTSPLLEWIYPARLIRDAALGAPEDVKAFTVLVPVALPSAGPELLRMATSLARSPRDRIYALHLVPASDQSMIDPGRLSRPSESEILQPLLVAAQEQNVGVRPLSFVSQNVGRDITEVARAKSADLILMGWHKPVLRQSILSGTIYAVMSAARADVAVYLPRHFRAWHRVLVPYLGSVHDLGALELAKRLAAQGDLDLTVLHVVRPTPSPPAAPPGVSLEDVAGSAALDVRVVMSQEPLDVVVEEARAGYDLVVIGVSEALGLQPTLLGTGHERLAEECPASMLIVHKWVEGGDARALRANG